MPFLASTLSQRYNTSLTGSLLFDKTVSPAGCEILTVTIQSAIDSYIRYEWGVFAANPIRGKIKVKKYGCPCQRYQGMKKEQYRSTQSDPRY